MNFVWYNIDTGFVSHRRETKTVRGYIEEGEQQHNRREPIATLSLVVEPRGCMGGASPSCI
jgi:hypothetical protein